MTQKGLVRAGAILLLLGLITGLFVPSPAFETRSLLAAHLNALLGAFLLWGLAFSFPMLSHGQRGRARVAWLLIAGTYGNWALTALKSWLHVPGLAWTGQPANDAVFAALVVVVVLPSLAGAAGWVLGLF